MKIQNYCGRGRVGGGGVKGECEQRIEVFVKIKKKKKFFFFWGGGGGGGGRVGEGSDFSTLYTTLPHDLIKNQLIDLIENTFRREEVLYLACNEE